MTDVPEKAVERAGRALEGFAKHGPNQSMRAAVERLVPVMRPLSDRGESWATIAAVLRNSGLAIKPALLRSYYKDAVRKQGGQVDG